MTTVNLYVDLNVDYDINVDFDGVFIADDTESISTYKQAPNKNTLARVKRHKAPKVCKYEYAAKMAADIGDIEENEHITAIVSGNFIAGDFIEAYLFENELIADEIIISTLSYSRENVDSLKNIQDFRLDADTGKMGLIVSEYFFCHERAGGILDAIKNLGDHRGFALAAAGIHTKITLIKTRCGKHIVVGGSANLRSSGCVEHITIDNNKILYQFHWTWMANILNHHQATHENLRRKKLWHVVQQEQAQKEQNQALERYQD